jgi:hypothetical protein
MADKSRSEKYYGKGDKKGGDKKPAKKEEHPHVKERMEAHTRHATARDELHKQQEAEFAAMAERHGQEMGTQGNAPAAAAGPATGANGAAPGTPAAVAGTAPAA